MRTIETSKARPRAPSQAAKVKKNREKKISWPIKLKDLTINQNTLNIIYSNLNKIFSKCLRFLQKTHNPQIILKTGIPE